MSVCGRGIFFLLCTCLALAQDPVVVSTPSACERDPCENGGTCKGWGEYYWCMCTTGYQGRSSEDIVDNCLSDPCENGGTCNNAIGSYSCACVAGYDGNNCQNNIDDCPGVICANSHHVCHDGINSYSCGCPNGFTGDQCDINIDECESNPCVNGGTCQDGVSGYTCTCQEGFNGANCDFVYWSFETLDNLVLMQGSQQKNYPAQISGKVGKAVKTDRKMDRWISTDTNLGCMHQPETCGAAGGAISIWLKVHPDYRDRSGVMSSVEWYSFLSQSTGILFSCLSYACNYAIRLSDGSFYAQGSRPDGWFHLVVNYIGPEDDQGIRVYYNGDQEGSDINKNKKGITAGDGRIALGRYYTQNSWRDGSVVVD